MSIQTPSQKQRLGILATHAQWDHMLDVPQLAVDLAAAAMADALVSKE